MGFLVVAEHPSKNVTARRKASALGCGTSQNSSEPRWTWLQNTQKEKCLKDPRVPRGDPCTWSPPTPGRLENEAARALEEESPGRTPAVSDTISTQSLSKVVKLGLQLEWPVNPELNTFNGGSRHLGNIHRPINTSLDITLRETLHSPGKQ